MKINEKIMTARKKAGMSQIDLADVMGVSRQSVSKWETGEANPEITKLKQLADALNVSVDWLLSEEDTEENASRERTETVSAGQTYPEWIDRLPKWIGGFIRRYGWVYGVYMAVAGALVALVGLIGRVMARNFIFGSSGASNGSFGGLVPGINNVPVGLDPFDQMNQSAWRGFSLMTGFVIGLGLLIMVCGIILAIALKKWGKKNAGAARE